jgi:hypothetical protein
VSGFADQSERAALRDRIERIEPGMAAGWESEPLPALRFMADRLEKASADQRRYGGTAAKFLDDVGLSAVD